MPPHALTPTPRTYAQLRDAVAAVVIHGRSAIDRAWLETYHETGRLINEHILLFRHRANYGARTFEKLAADTGISKRTLQECAQFHRCFPIARHVAQLGWNRCRLLCQVDDRKRREALTMQAVKNDWSSGEIAERVRSFNAVALAVEDDDPTPAPEKPIELLKPRCGIPGLRRIVERPDGLGIDLGFKNYAALNVACATRLKLGDIVRWDEDGVRKVADATPAQLFTYRATIDCPDGARSAEMVNAQRWPGAAAEGARHRVPSGRGLAQLTTAARRAAKSLRSKPPRPPATQ